MMPKALAFIKARLSNLYTIFIPGLFISALLLLFLSFLVSVVFYPIFACLNSSSRMIGSAVGFLYTLLLWVFTKRTLCHVILFKL